MLIFLRLLRSTIGLAILRFAWRRRAPVLRLLRRWYTDRGRRFRLIH
jgi:hypothetical protein